MAGDAVLGFDVREDWLDGARWLPPERRATYLLREVAKPLSVDRWTWPSPFGPDLSHPSYPAEVRALAFPVADPPSPMLPQVPLFRELAALRAAAPGLVATHGPCRLVAVTGDPGPDRGAVLPAAEPSWSFLGYDVADAGLLSGLSNCGYEEDERAALRARFGQRLNEHHLFAAREDAEAFRGLTDRRVPEHAPFSVYGLWEVARLSRW